MIITTAQAKALLQITGTTYDTLISALIPEVEAKYLQIRNIPFLQVSGSITSGDKTITGISAYPYDTYNYYVVGYPDVQYINRMDYLYNSTNSIDNYVTDIDPVNNTLELDIAPSTTAEDVVFTVYPQGSKMTAAKLIKYMMNKNSMSGLQSESVGSYSWSAGSEKNPFGIPDDIYKSIKRYANV